MEDSQFPLPSPRERLVAVGSFLGVGAAVSLLYTTTGLGLPCPFRELTGWLCPFCGATRMGAALWHGDLVAAWRSNPVLLVVGALVAVRTLGWVVEWVRHPQHASRWAPRGVSRHGWAIAVGLGVAWTLAGNLF